MIKKAAKYIKKILTSLISAIMNFVKTIVSFFKKIKGHYKKVLILLLVILVPTTSYILLRKIIFNPITTTFNVTVETERIVYISRNNDNIYFHSVIVKDIINNATYNDFNGRISINPNVSIAIKRVAFGPISITFKNKDKKSKSIGELYDGKEDTFIASAGKYVKVFLPDVQQRLSKGESIIFSIRGDFSELSKPIYKIANAKNTALLKSGQVTMIKKSWLGNTYYAAGSEKLNLGDCLKFIGTP